MPQDGPTPTQEAPHTASELHDEILGRAEAFYVACLWETDIGESVRRWIAEHGVEERLLREFGIGYAPGGWTELLDHLARWAYSPEDLHAAGVATLSERGRLHVDLRSRIIFPFRDDDGRLSGFAGRATHAGPSWPEWLTSPERGRFSRDTALFGIDGAAEAISSTGHAIVTRDCLETLRLHQAGRLEAVAVVRVDITMGHLTRLAPRLATTPDRLLVDRETPGDGFRTAFRVRPGSEAEIAARRAESPSPQRAPTSAMSATRIVADAAPPLTTRARMLLYGLSLVLGVALPLGWLQVIGEGEGVHGQQTGFMVSVGAVTASYAVLTVVAAVVSGRVRSRSRARRMRAPWERGGTEWQPIAWTYHHFEEILIGAALVSIVVCLALFFAIGGFTGG